eukprot:16302453-Heterocapsa_arctica.AAC.1
MPCRLPRRARQTRCQHSGAAVPPREAPAPACDGHSRRAVQRLAARSWRGAPPLAPVQPRHSRPQHVPRRVDCWVSHASARGLGQCTALQDLPGVPGGQEHGRGCSAGADSHVLLRPRTTTSC